MVPINREHKEAEQNQVSAELENFIKTLPKEEADKFRAVQKCEKILSDVGVAAYIFPLLKCSSKTDKYTVYQFNTLLKLMEYGENDKPTKNSYSVSALLHSGLLYTIFQLFRRNFEGKNFGESVSNFANFVGYSIGVVDKYMDWISRPDDEQSNDEQKDGESK